MTYRQTSALEAYEMLDGYRVIDVREEHEFRGPLGCIESAELVPLGTIEAAAADFIGGPSLLLVCRSGKRSGRACEKLEGLGCEDVTNLAGGMIGWNRAGLPILHCEPDSLRALVDEVITWVAQVGPLSLDAARDVVRDRFDRQFVSFEVPTHRAVDELIGFFGDSLASDAPPDLDLSLAAFRRSLAVL